MTEVPSGVEVRCGNILIIGEHRPAIVLELGENCVEVSDVDTDDGKELIHWIGGTVVASYIDRIDDRWSKERMIQAIIAGIDFYAKQARQTRVFPEETRTEWINSALNRLNENYPKDPITLT